MAKPNITSCIGFAFPKLPQNDTHSYKQSVVQVKITWDMKKLCFIYDLQPLVLAEVKTALEQALRMNESQRLEYQDDMNEMYVAWLSTEDMKVFGDEATQVPSKSSILGDVLQTTSYRYPLFSHFYFNGKPPATCS